MARLTEQYMEYVEVMRTRNLELAAEYLVMAAMLMEINRACSSRARRWWMRRTRTRVPSSSGACSSTRR